MALVLECGVTGSRLKMDDVSFSPCRSVGSPDGFNLHNGSFDLSSHEFYDSVGMTSTPSASRNSELHQRSDYDTDDSGFCDSIVSDSDLLQMSNLRLADESQCENVPCTKWSDSFPLPKLCLMPHFDEHCDGDGKSVVTELEEPCRTVAQLVIVEAAQSERASMRRQRSPDVSVSRCSRHRLSLDSFSESRTDDDSPPTRRSSDSFVVPLSDADLSPPPAEVDDTDPSHPTVESPLHGIPSPRSVSPSSTVSPPQSSSTSFDDAVFEDQLRRILAEFSPPCIRQLIGRKMGQEHVDIIAELSKRAMTMVVRNICSYLSDTDLASLMLVSVQWRNVVQSDRCLEKRVTAHSCRLRLVTKLQSKENAVKSKRSSRAVVTRPLVSATSVTRPLQSCVSYTNVAPSSPDLTRSSPPSAAAGARTLKSVADVARPSSSSRHACQFWKEAEKLYRGETLTKCPRCHGPSRTDAAQERGRCTSASCRFDFCLLCQLPFHSSRACRATASGSASPRDSYIGSRKSRRHLKRL